MDPSSYYDDFWRASEYSPYNLSELAKLQESFSGQQKESLVLAYPQAPLPLSKQKRSALFKIEDKRRSTRVFLDTPLLADELSDVLSSFRVLSDLEHRTYASAGATYGLEVFCLTYNVADYKNKLLYYNPDQHGVTVLADAPSWQTVTPNVNIETDGTPHCIIIFVSFFERVTAKYGERGGRFALIECGSAVQQLSLHLAGSKRLGGCAAGGLIDGYWSNLLGLENDRAQILLGYVCGVNR